MSIDRSTLVLNQNYEPLNVCSVRRAFVLVYHGKADLIEDGRERIRGVGRSFRLPSVIRLRRYVRRPQPRLRLTRREVFARDQQRCQYCGKQQRDLTLDHIKPRHRGGRHEWENLVAACRRCNHRKAGRTPKEAGMKLLSRPVRPRATPGAMFGHYLQRYDEWQPFLIGWLDDATRSRLSAESAS
ncbi:MAG: HNH endonuclease [Dehalococcoidia bacterium]